MKGEKLFLFALNLLTRFLGVLFLISGLGTALTIFLQEENRSLRVCIAIVLMGIGIASFFAKPISSEHLKQIRRSIGHR